MEIYDLVTDDTQILDFVSDGPVVPFFGKGQVDSYTHCLDILRVISENRAVEKVAVLSCE